MIDMADQNGTERLAYLIAAVEKHTAFLEGALGLDMTPLFQESDVARAKMEGGPTEIVACRLRFPSPTAESGYMNDSIVFENLEDMAAFLENIVLLFRIARAQQRLA
jgi:hypothetical protein